MPRKDRKRYNEYMKRYMREYRKTQREYRREIEKMLRQVRPNLLDQAKKKRGRKR